MNREQITHYRNTYRDMLLGNLLPFWIKHGIDREYGGFTIMLDRDGSLLDTDKGLWQHGRFTWLLGELYNHIEKRPDWLDLAKHGADFIEKFGFDRRGDGRMYFHLDREGRPIRKRRYAFSESFTAIAYGEYAKATGSSYFRQRAIELLEFFVRWNNTPGLMPPKFTDTRPARGLSAPMIAIVTAQQIRESVGYERATDLIDQAIGDIRKYFVKPDLRVVMEMTGPNGEIYDHFDGRTLNPGHSIEAAWFIMNEGKYRGDRDLIRLGCDMLDWMWERGWDPEYGGLLYFRDLYNKPVQEYWHDMKFWWPQNEAEIATLMAYQLTGDARYEKMHRMVHEWSFQHFPDPEYGGWFGYLHRDGSLSAPLKGNLYKGPFHIPRMLYTCWQLCEEMLRKQG